MQLLITAGNVVVKCHMLLPPAGVEEWMVDSRVEGIARCRRIGVGWHVSLSIYCRWGLFAASFFCLAGHRGVWKT